MRIITSALAGAMLLAGGAASAQTVAAEANVARSEGAWGLEIGAGPNLRAGPINLRPMAGVFVETWDGGDARLYARAEATVDLPLIAEIGAGARFSRDRLRPYATAGFDLLPGMQVKGNLGERYAAIGLLGRF